MDFSGTFDYTLDAKNRLTVPAKMRPSLAEPLMLTRGTSSRCVTIWRRREFEQFIADATTGMGPMDPKRDKILRFFVSSSFPAELDSAGRVMLPVKLMEYGGFGKDLVVNGVGDRIEIWDRAAWTSYMDQQDADDLAALFADSPA